MTLHIGKVLELEDVDNGLDDYRSTSNLTFEQYRYYLFKEVREIISIIVHRGHNRHIFAHTRKYSEVFNAS